MTETSRPWSGHSVGDAGPYTASIWQALYHDVLEVGVVLTGSGDGSHAPLQVGETSPASAGVEVAVGSALVQGIHYRNDAALTLAIAANASGNPRIDLIVLRANYITQTVRLAVKQGAPAVSPSAPTATQTAGTLWEEAIAQVAVADSFTTISDADVTNIYRGAGSLPAGVIQPYAGASAPEGWLLADGSAVSRVGYPGLFSLFGEAFGAGDGSTTFNLPDLRGRVPLGLDNLGGTSADRVTDAQADLVGGSGGEETHTLTIAEMAAHAHSVTGRVGSTSSGSFQIAGSSSGSSGALTNGTDAGGGSDQPHNNMPPYLTLSYIIKA